MCCAQKTPLKSPPELEIIFSKEANDDDGLMTENRALSRKFSKQITKITWQNLELSSIHVYGLNRTLNTFIKIDRE